MYVTTFYSYKGGVGRTMALANVATTFVRQGRRVVLVDFDLEAPGLDTFKLLKPQKPTRGIVEYVSDYLTFHEAPNVADYMYEVSLPAPKLDHSPRSLDERSLSEGTQEDIPVDSGKTTGRLWIMPAGLRDQSYSSLLQNIDWPSLYADRDGYLMIEDLKAQWKQSFKPDYVLVDSRTGHTDVAGICTRQLPDAVVLLFFPNDQNLRGLETVVRDIRDDSKPPRNKHVTLHFVMSNVPDLDDEDSILRNRRSEFRQKLQFRRSLVVHHYNSLTLLNQSIFCEDRRRSRLAEEYRLLAQEIVRQNPEDKEGALLFLKQYVEEGRKGLFSRDETEQMLAEIQEKHAGDGDIQAQLAFLRMEDGQPDRAKLTLEKAIKMEVSSPGTLVRRAQCRLLLLADRDGATTDALAALAHSEINEADTFKAIRMLGEQKATERLREVLESAEIKKLRPSVRYIIASELENTALVDLPFKIHALKSVIDDPRSDQNLRRNAEHSLVLPLIAVGKFTEAMRILVSEPAEFKELDIQDTFNYAMAQWGAFGKPNPSLFERVIQLDSQGLATGHPNYAQCLAVAYWVIGDSKKATEFVDRAESILERDEPNFSCWRYLEVDSSKFRMDLALVRDMVSGGAHRPEVLERNQGVDHPSALLRS